MDDEDDDDLDIDDVVHHQGAEEVLDDGDNGHQHRELEDDTIEDESHEAPGAEGAENQGAEAQGAEVQGAEVQGADDQGAGDQEEELNEDDDDEDDDSLSENSPSDEESSDDSSDSESEPEHRERERERRGDYFADHNNDQYGRGKRDRDKPSSEAYSFLQTKFMDLTDEDKRTYFKQAWNDYKTSGKTNMLEKFTCGLAFAQLSAKQGIKKYGRAAELKLLNEFRQLIDYKTFHGRKADELSEEEKLKAANMINLIEEKTNRGHTPENPVIKGRSVFNGRVQRGLYTKEETASPTVSQDAFFLTSIIDAIEERDIAITDIKGAYLNAKMKGVVIMKITGPEVDLFCEIDPSLKEFVTYENGKKVLYVQLDKALYGCVQSALLWYDLYSSTLQEMGFILNPYDLCVANSTIEGKQCTICWYVDDNKISHVNPKVVDKVISMIEKKFGKMSTTRGKGHDFLGMNISFNGKKLRVSMKNHILKAIDEFDEDIVRNAATPAKAHLFSTRETAKKLDEKRAENFHSVNALLLFVSRRCRLDIQTAVGFLCTRVSSPDEDDWIKLRRVLQYLRGTIDLVLTLGADDITKMKSWVDVSYGVHDDCKSHTGGAISWGWGVLLTKCQKQKLNTKSSTEGEVVGVRDFMPNMVWARMFLEAQGFILSENILFQDNKSAMKMLMNGRRSSGQKSKHIDARYFWIKDRLEKEGIDMKYCPTEKMIADFFTKPLQGKLFRKIRDIILGYKHISSLDEIDECTSNEERVGSNKEENVTSPFNGQTSIGDMKTTRRTYVDVLKNTTVGC
jgi:hypothetical protein